MNRLQKKCVIATAGVHLLLIVILFVGPAFFYPKPKADDLPVLDVIPANLIDAAFNSGVANATPPPPVSAGHSAATASASPKVEKTEPVKPPDKLSPDSLKPVEKTSKTEPRKGSNQHTTRDACRAKKFRRRVDNSQATAAAGAGDPKRPSEFEKQFNLGHDN